MLWPHIGYIHAAPTVLQGYCASVIQWLLRLSLTTDELGAAPKAAPSFKVALVVETQARAPCVAWLRPVAPATAREARRRRWGRASPLLNGDLIKKREEVSLKEGADPRSSQRGCGSSRRLRFSRHQNAAMAGETKISSASQ
jgi:hypothetical protein